MGPRNVHVYIEPRDVWIGYFRGDTHHYVCPLPTVVIRWDRRVKETVLGGPDSAVSAPEAVSASPWPSGGGREALSASERSDDLLPSDLLPADADLLGDPTNNWVFTDIDDQHVGITVPTRDGGTIRYRVRRSPHFPTAPSPETDSQR